MVQVAAGVTALSEVLVRTRLTVPARAAYAVLNQRDQRPEWLAARNTLVITASDAAAVLGVSPFRSRSALYDAQVAGGKKTFTNPAMMRGTALERRAGGDYGAAAGLDFEDVGLFVHLQHTWLGASPDGQIAGQPDTLLEIKIPSKVCTATSIPHHYLVQLLVQLECAGAEKVCTPVHECSHHVNLASTLSAIRNTGALCEVVSHGDDGLRGSTRPCAL